MTTHYQTTRPPSATANASAPAPERSSRDIVHAIVGGPAPAAARGAIASALGDTLGQLRTLVESLDAQQYVAVAGPAFLGATIGGHVRHTIDHVAPIVDLPQGGCIDYDRRVRGTPIERDPIAAGVELTRLGHALRELSSGGESRVEIVLIPRAGAPEVRLASTPERELAFALSHTVHHCAMIRGILAMAGVDTPSTFGYAPSTIAHRGHDACAR